MHYGEGLGRAFVCQICAKFGCFNGVKERGKIYICVKISDGVFKVRYFPKLCLNIESKFGGKHHYMGKVWVGHLCVKFAPNLGASMVLGEAQIATHT